MTGFAYPLGGCALIFMCSTFYYQSVANNQLDEILALKEQVCTLKNGKPVRSTGQLPTLAERNHNPLNIKSLKNGEKWEGQVDTDMQGHAVFITKEYGLRAASFVLKNYQMRHGIRTVRGIVERFAEGNREEYISFLCRELGVKHDEEIDIIKRMSALLKAMSRFESGERLPEHLFAAYDVMGKI